jgi:hypothetical protein
VPCGGDRSKLAVDTRTLLFGLSSADGIAAELGSRAADHGEALSAESAQPVFNVGESW